jgi:hypothetical protein
MKNMKKTNQKLKLSLDKEVISKFKVSKINLMQIKGGSSDPRFTETDPPTYAHCPTDDWR